MRIAVYIRVSTQRQAEAQTIEQQLSCLQTFCQSKEWSWPPAFIFRDDGYSGATLKRPGLDSLRDFAARASFDLLLITAPDRLARKYVHQMLLVEELEKLGCQLQFVEHPLSQDPHDQLLLQIRGAVAEYERSLIAERMRRGRLHKFQTGALLPWTSPPFGYRMGLAHPRDPAGLHLEPTEAAIVAEIFQRYLQPQQSLWGLVNYFTKIGLPTPSGKARWNKTSLRWILTNPVYSGTVFAQRSCHQPARKRYSAMIPVGKNNTTLKWRPSEEWIEVCQVEAIVTKEQFEQVQNKLRKNQLEASRNNTTHQYLLRAMLSCGSCKRAFHCRSAKGRGYYVCDGKKMLTQTGMDAKCTISRCPHTQQLDELVWQDLCALLQDPGILKQALERAQSGEWLPQELQSRQANLHKAIAKLGNQIERLTEAYLAGILLLEEYKRRRAEFEQRQASINEQLKELSASSARHLEVVKVAQNLEEFCHRIASSLEQANFEQKRQLVELLIDRIVITGEEVEIHYVVPTTPASEQVRFCYLRSTYTTMTAYKPGITVKSYSFRQPGFFEDLNHGFEDRVGIKILSGYCGDQQRSAGIDQVKHLDQMLLFPFRSDSHSGSILEIELDFS
ncbi:MAG: recombinase family protein [Chloroflexi bacterium]|nr:recombinase family protein [Chloroflexota bacterium]